MIFPKLTHISLLLGTLCLFSSCQNRNYEDRIPVTGMVTLNGTPLLNGFIAFIGDEGYAVASGAIRNGQYELSESASRHGITSGIYSIQFESWIETPGEELPSGGFSKGVSAIPEKYQDFRKSDLKAEVTPSQRHFVYALSSDES
ncbi:MAG TPA: hypothetical protein VNQ76_16455 [Planctomicrobium sp.]|nr:hypothetical protein [Planctomicrobium sp.]